MKDPYDMSPLILEDLRVEASSRTRKRLFGRPKTLPMLRVSVPGYEMEFDYPDVRELAEGPILISAVSSKPEGDYFLASPSLIEPSSSVGESLRNVHFNRYSLLLLQGPKILAEVSAAQQLELIAWLKQMPES